MEEADALSDRIAIMNRGDVKCCGSPMFLKNLFGSGYRLTASKANSFNEIEFFKSLSKNIGNYKIESNIAAEIAISLSHDAATQLPSLLNEIEQNKEKIGITGYGITSPTIEEVFLKLKIFFSKILK